MTLVETILQAWDKTMETKDSEHLGAYLADDFEFMDSNDEKDSRSETLDWSAKGECRIGDFKTIYEDDKVMCATHSATDESAGPSTAMIFAKHENGKATFWKILRAFDQS